jgi:hypothetical protein
VTPAPTPPLTGDAEVEMFGKWQPGTVKARRVVFVAQAEPCLPPPANPKRWGETALEKPGSLFAEYFIPQSSVGHLCLYAFDKKGKVIGTAGYARNPVTFRGEGEVVIQDIELRLEPIDR